MTSTLTSKGQVTLPKKYRDYLGVKPGEQVVFKLSPTGEVVVRALSTPQASRPAKAPFDALRGSLATGKSTDELLALLRGYDQDVCDPGFQ